MLKQEYKENETSLKEALELAVKVFGKTLDTNKLTSEKGKHLNNSSVLLQERFNGENGNLHLNSLM